MRIAHVSDCYLPRTGGIETQVRALAMQQVLRGQEVDVITATPGHLLRSGTEVIDEVTVHRVTAHLPFSLPIHPRTRANVLKVLKQTPVDLVHVHVGVVSPFAWGAVRAVRELGLPLVITVHGVWGPLAAPGYRVSDALAHWSKWGARISAVSNVAARRIEAAVPSIGHVAVLPNGIDPEQWRVPPRNREPRTLNLVTVMRLAPRKRALPLLKVLNAARSKVGAQAHLHLRIIGDGPERTRAEAYVGQHGLTDLVTFTGRLDHAGIREIFAMSDVYVQPSVRESFGIAALEARCAGLPVVARSQTGTTEFIRDYLEGLLVQTDAQMAEALATLATHRPLLDQLATFNRTHTPDQAWPTVLARVDEEYAIAVALG